MGFLIGRAGTVCNPHRDALRMTRKPQAAIHLWRCSAPHLATRRGRVSASACGQVAGARQWLKTAFARRPAGECDAARRGATRCG